MPHYIGGGYAYPPEWDDEIDEELDEEDEIRYDEFNQADIDRDIRMELKNEQTNS